MKKITDIEFEEEDIRKFFSTATISTLYYRLHPDSVVFYAALTAVERERSCKKAIRLGCDLNGLTTPLEGYLQGLFTIRTDTHLMQDGTDVHKALRLDAIGTPEYNRVVDWLKKNVDPPSTPTRYVSELELLSKYRLSLEALLYGPADRIIKGNPDKFPEININLRGFDGKSAENCKKTARFLYGLTNNPELDTNVNVQEVIATVSELRKFYIENLSRLSMVQESRDPLISHFNSLFLPQPFSDFCVRLPEERIQQINGLVNQGLYSSPSHLIREAVRFYLEGKK